MLLGDMGADVIRIERLADDTSHADRWNPTMIKHRNRRSIVVDLKLAEGVELVLRLVESSDVLIEGNRPGVMERLGLGPDVCLERNERLVYGRMTGSGPRLARPRTESVTTSAISLSAMRSG